MDFTPPVCKSLWLFGILKKSSIRQKFVSGGKKFVSKMMLFVAYVVKFALDTNKCHKSSFRHWITPDNTARHYVVQNRGNCSEPTSKTLRVSSVRRIRQIDLYKKVLLNASIHRSFLINLLGSEQLQIGNKSFRLRLIHSLCISHRSNLQYLSEDKSLEKASLFLGRGRVHIKINKCNYKQVCIPLIYFDAHFCLHAYYSISLLALQRKFWTPVRLFLLFMLPEAVAWLYHSLS